MSSEGRAAPVEAHEAAVEELIALARPAPVAETVRTFWWLCIPIGIIAAFAVIARVASVGWSQHVDLGVVDVVMVHALFVGSMGCTFAGRAAWWRGRLRRIRAKFSEPGYVRTRIADAKSGRVELLAKIHNATVHPYPRMATVVHAALGHERDLFVPTGQHGYGRTWAGREQWQDPERFSVAHSSVACTLDDGSGEVISVPENAFEVLDLFDGPSGCAHIDDGDEVLVRGEVVRDVPGDPSESANYREGHLGARLVITGTSKPLIAPASLRYAPDRIERTGHFRVTVRGFVATTIALSLQAALVIYLRHDSASASIAVIFGAIVPIMTAMVSFNR